MTFHCQCPRFLYWCLPSDLRYPVFCFKIVEDSTSMRKKGKIKWLWWMIPVTSGGLCWAFPGDALRLLKPGWTSHIRIIRKLSKDIVLWGAAQSLEHEYTASWENNSCTQRLDQVCLRFFEPCYPIFDNILSNSICAPEFITKSKRPCTYHAYNVYYIDNYVMGE